VHVDASVPATVAVAARAIAQREWARLGPGASDANAEIFIYVDSTTIPRATGTTSSRVVIEPRRLVDIGFALPEATDGKRCVTLVRLRGTTEAHRDALRHASLGGVCGFFAAFGLPGAGIGRWLSSTGYAFARQNDWDVARAPSVDSRAIYGLSVGGSRCLTGKPNACAGALRGAMNGLANSPGQRPAAIGEAEGRLLADMVRDLGPERFARFWRADTTPDAAFATAAGTSLEPWMQGWLSRTYGAAPESPALQVPDVLWLAAATPVLLLVAARRRERILGESPFRSAR